MERLNLCKEVLENAIGVHRNLEKIEPLNAMDTVAVQAMEELLKYRDAEEQGLLLRLPCKVGTTVYCIEDECEDIYIEGSNYRFVGEERFDTWMLDQFGKTVFLTKEEAEQALAEMKGV